MRLFIREEKYKLVATTLVATGFLYFWIQGPLQHGLEVLSQEQEVTEFSNPKMVGDLDRHNHTGYGTLEFGETGGFGYGLILAHETPKPHFALLTTDERHPALSSQLAEKILAHAEKLTPPGGSYELGATADMYYAENGETLYLESTGVVRGIRGYAGPVNVAVFLSAEGEILAAHHISSRETESYLQRIERGGFYEQFQGIRIEGEHQVDAVSGATLTSEAIAHTISALIAEAAPEPLANFAGTDELSDFSIEARLNLWWILHIAVIFLMFLYGFQKKLRKSKTGIIALSLLSVLYIGFFLNNSFTYVSFIHPFVGTSVSSLVGLYALFTLLGAIWGKNTYCKYVCPFGNVQRLLIQVTPKKAKSKFFMSNKWIYRIRGAIALVLITGVLLGLRSWSNFELFPDLFGLDFLSFWFTVALASVLIAIRYPMIWCRLLCPTGSVLDFISDVVNRKK